ncbi:protein SPA1-RELATED 4-like isoform X2 [Salvia hispanica]|uniref:protein SPA1-RELATED 4-like isoform X2 n=1 Tax=Salvia hispanica TaxID=49212 RepID=UPI00200997F6|nr:protein SPA1-RELATED 4-like isoform X2 [Salvia hispanica]
MFVFVFVFVSWDSCKHTNSERWIVMEGSSESGWERSDSSRGLNSSFLARNSRILRGGAVRFSGDNSSHDSVRKGRPWAHVTSHGGLLPGSEGGAVACNDVSLRKWLDNPERAVDALECLHIFSQIVDVVNLAHSQGIVLHNVRPSCFVMSSYSRVSFIESASCSDSGSDSPEYGSNSQMAEFKGSPSVLPPESQHSRSQYARLARNPASQINSESSCLQSSSGQAVHGSDGAANERTVGDKKQSFPMKQILLMESNWYTTPEQVSGDPTSSASDIYQLGVLLFELFCTFDSLEEKSSTMASLRHRVLPPQLLLKWPKEASFCLWLLHPEPSSRPKMSELLQSEFLSEPRNEIQEREAAIDLREMIEEQELLLEFLLILQQMKQEAADNLNETISLISSDIEEVTKLHTSLRMKGGLSIDFGKGSGSGPNLMSNADDDDSGSSGSRKRIRQGLDTSAPDESEEHADIPQKPETHGSGSFLSKSSRLMKNFRKLESAYFLTRRRSLKIPSRSLARHSQVSSDGRGGSNVATERSSISNPSSRDRNIEQKPNGWINTFLEGLCKYLSFSKLKVKADLKQGDLLNSSNLVCSLSFDRDGEFFASAGVNKKIKVFEYNSILNEDRDIHYPVVEMASRSKLSSICWNSYIKGQIASSNFEGVVQVWDVTRSQTFMEMREHERRVWSVDFSVADPTMLASGSDDGSVKLWNINQGVSVDTIKTKANVCCVQFPTDSGRTLAFGSADHKIYYYDLRTSKMPLCTLVGHKKTVSYVKFIDSTTLVSASTDNTLKLWDLSMCTSRVLDCPLQSFTGHLNVKVFVYHKALPMPALSFKFNSTDPLSGDEVDDTAQFISSVCWRGQSSTLVAANSMGNIKLLEMA